LQLANRVARGCNLRRGCASRFFELDAQLR